ncbi:hypothetical protein I4U23_020280 [Adineta vaga]|nr:hypothetical protein I4U23_020280 [Adineta vaga]
MTTNLTDYNLIEKYSFLSQQLAKYGGSLSYLICIYGTLMNMLMFSQSIYNRRACSLYLLIASVCDFMHLNLGLLPYILQYGFHYYRIITTLLFFKIKTYLVYVLSTISATLLTLAIMLRYILSSKNNSRWRHGSHRNIIRNIISTIGFWTVISIPIFFCSHSCQYSFDMFVQLVYICLFNSIIPSFLMMIFGFLTYKNAYCLYQRSQTKSFSLRRINEQLTLMFIYQSIKSTLTSLPYGIFKCYLVLTKTQQKSLIIQAKENLVHDIVQMLFWSNYSSFFIYICSSNVFRKQFIKALKKLICCQSQTRRTFHYN